MVARKNGRFSWLYRLRPSVVHSSHEFIKIPEAKSFAASARGTLFLSPPWSDMNISPSPMRWFPLNSLLPDGDGLTFIQGLITMAGHGDPKTLSGGAACVYAFNKSMNDSSTSPESFFFNADADMLIIPQEGAISIRTEFGEMSVAPLEIAEVPRGIKFQVNLGGGVVSARGYVCENYGSHFVLPDLGPIGLSSGLANPRHFLSPIARYEDRDGRFKLVGKYQGYLWESDTKHSPLDVVAWWGNYVPYKYDLTLFCTINAASFDHPDPSIFTVLTSPAPAGTPGTANMDFAIFPPRWMVAEKTFRPPWFHRNCMSEYMGLIKGVYDAKPKSFLPGGSSIHNRMVPHGPDHSAWEEATSADTSIPKRYDDTMAFMLESSLAWTPSPFAMGCGLLDRDYSSCWSSGLKKNFDIRNKELPAHPVRFMK